MRQARWLHEHGDEYRQMLLRNIKERLPQLNELLVGAEDHWGMEDGIYRFYHQSFKVYRLQALTEQICKSLQELLPDRPLNKWFSEIVAQGTGHQFEMEHNENWLRHTRSIVEASFHAHYFLKMVCKYGKELETSPNTTANATHTIYDPVGRVVRIELLASVVFFLVFEGPIRLAREEVIKPVEWG